jgi:drug/metabolite transporter (DMT)-like permease
MTRSQLLMLCSLAAIWGASFLFIRMALPYFGPVALSGGRSLIGALALSPFLMGRIPLAYLRSHGWHLLAIGAISTAVPFLCLTLSTKYTSAGFASILNALTPICSALIGFVWLQERLSPAALLGILLGFIGVSVMVLDRDTISSSFPLLPVAAGLAATFCYGLTGFYIRRYLQGIPSPVLSAYCQFAAALLMLPFIIPLWPAGAVPLQGWLLAAALGILCTGIAFILYFHLLSHIGVARTVVVTYLVPVFALLWGALFLDESATPKMLAGAALILTGIGLTTRAPRLKPTTLTPPVPGETSA